MSLISVIVSSQGWRTDFIYIVTDTDIVHLKGHLIYAQYYYKLLNYVRFYIFLIELSVYYFFFFFTNFIYLLVRERVQAGRRAKGQADSPVSTEPHGLEVGVNPRILRSDQRQHQCSNDWAIQAFLFTLFFEWNLLVFWNINSPSNLYY